MDRLLELKNMFRYWNGKATEEEDPAAVWRAVQMANKYREKIDLMELQIKGDQND